MTRRRADLLEKAGVDTVKKLATPRPDNLHAKLVDTKDGDQITRQPPSLAMVESWGQQAKELPKTLGC